MGGWGPEPRVGVVFISERGLADVAVFLTVVHAPPTATVVSDLGVAASECPHGTDHFSLSLSQ